MFDTDRSGGIDRYELKKALRQLGMEADSAQTQGVLQKYDSTGRGTLDLASFNKLVQELLAFQKTGNPKAKLDEKDTLSAPLRVMVFAAANDKGGGRRELASATIELTTADVNLSRLELPLLTPTGKTLGYACVSLNAHTAMAPFLAVRRAFEVADADRDGLLLLEEAHKAVLGLGIEISRDVLRRQWRGDASAAIDAHRFEQLYSRLLELPESEMGASALGSGSGAADHGPELPEAFRTLLFQKRFALPLRLGQCVAFWVDAHSSLELLEVRNADLRLVVSAHDDRGELRTCSATLFDGAAYFHQPLGSAVKGGPSWVFPGPFFYELSVQPGAAPLERSEPPRHAKEQQAPVLELLLRTVSRFERAELVHGHHPLLERPAAEHTVYYPAEGAQTHGAPPAAQPYPAVQQPPGGARVYGAPGGAPAYGAPGGAPGYGAPGYGAPGYGAPGYGALGSAASAQLLEAYTRPRPPAPYPAAQPPPAAQWGAPHAGPAFQHHQYAAAHGAAVDPYAPDGRRHAAPPSVMVSCGRGDAVPQPASGQQLHSAALRAAFDQHDTNRSGTLSLKEVGKALQPLGLRMGPQTLQRFSDSDRNRDGVLQFSEWCELVATLQREQQLSGDPKPPLSAQEVLLEATRTFDRFDTDANGYLSPRELRQALQELQLQTDSSEAIAILHEFDRDGDGKLNRAEFARLVGKLKQHQHGAQGQPLPPGPTLRASFGSFDHRGDGTIGVQDLRPALMRAGLDTANRVAVAMFSELQEQGRQVVDFNAFQRMAHAIAAHTGAVAPAAPPAPMPPYGGDTANPYALPPTAPGGALHQLAPAPPGYPPVQYPPPAGYGVPPAANAYYQQPLGVPPPGSAPQPYGYPAAARGYAAAPPAAVNPYSAMPASIAPGSSKVAGAPYNDPYAAYQASFGAAPYGGHQPPPPKAALPVAPPNAAAAEYKVEAKRHARKPHTPTKTKYVDVAGGGYSSAYALPAPTELKPRKL